MIFETLRIAINSLRANKLRTFLSMLGIIIGVGAVIAIVSIGSGAREQITAQISDLGSNVINILPGTSKGWGGKVSASSVDVFTLDLVDYIGKVSPSVRKVVPVTQGSGLLIKESINIQANIIGTNADYQEVTNYNLALGQFINSDDLDATRNVVVLGSGLAEDLFGNNNPLGEKIKLHYQKRDYLFTVIGLMEEKGGGLTGNLDNQAYIPITTYMKKLSNSRFVSYYIAQAKSSQESSAAVGEIEYFLVKYLEDEEKEKFSLISQDQILDTISSVTAALSLMLGGIAAISLLVGGIGIMNIMLVSVTERTREIGIRKALGAKRKNIMSQFLIEALSLSGLGGMIGILFGWLGAYFIAQAGKWPLVVTIPSVLLAFGFAMAIGLFFGLYPAMKAAKMDPVEALRYE
ncbi:MAG: ABC transporter permease [Candidatus Atribacteria bacterium]|nr:ABC transporter permease [Candidatus Atribacteria bacterium]MCK4309522.1 ABC transporter permease [Candidatus Atribacteria bacterium]